MLFIRILKCNVSIFNLSVINFGWPINKALKYDNLRRINELESIMSLFVLISGINTNHVSYMSYN